MEETEKFGPIINTAIHSSSSLSEIEQPRAFTRLGQLRRGSYYLRGTGSNHGGSFYGP